jgi:O-succinylhomoserine sulfhydrylase
MSPFNAWVMLKGWDTLSLRCDAQADTAVKIVDALRGHDKIGRILYPTDADHPNHELARRQMSRGGTVIAFEVKGGKEAAFRALNALNIVILSNNLGDAKSLATHPVTTTHKNLSPEARAAAGITDGLIRLSVGLEDSDDLIADILGALNTA